MTTVPGTKGRAPRRHRWSRWSAAAMLALAAPAALLAAGCSGDGDDRDEARAGVDENVAVMYSSPTCGCCKQYAAYLRTRGYSVDVRHPDDLGAVKADAGVPSGAEACHTTMIGDYFVEGHVPVAAVDDLLTEQPALDGIALPDMPAGSPGMGGAQTGPFEILAVDGDSLDVYMTL